MLELVIGASRLGGYAVARQPVISALISTALARAIQLRRISVEQATTVRELARHLDHVDLVVAHDAQVLDIGLAMA